MAKYKCPSCGAPYNGKVCRNCSYEHFSEEIAHGLHTHEGEPLVIDAPARKPVKRKDPFGCEKRPRKKHPLAGLLVLLSVITALQPLVRNWGLELEALEERYFAPEPETFIPENAQLLHEEGAIRIYAVWQEDMEDSSFPIYVENDYNYGVILSSQNVTVNGFLMEYSGFYCDAYKGSTSSASFYLDSTDLETACIGQIQTISFQLTAFDEDYTTLFTTDTITLNSAASSGYVQPTDLGGTLLYQQDGIRVSYLGYKPDDNSPDSLPDGTLQFYLENETGRTLQFYTPKALFADGETEAFFWGDIPPQTRGVINMYLYDLESSDIHSLEEGSPMELILEISDPEDNDFRVITDTLELPLE